MVMVMGACAGGAQSPVASDGSDTTDTAPTETQQDDSPAPTTPTSVSAGSTGQLCASVVGAQATNDGDTWTFALTVRSDDISATEFGDSWELRTLDGDVLATRVLARAYQ